MTPVEVYYDIFEAEMVNDFKSQESWLGCVITYQCRDVRLYRTSYRYGAAQKAFWLSDEFYLLDKLVFRSESFKGFFKAFPLRKRTILINFSFQLKRDDVSMEKCTCG